jgi:hypothetical protein
MDSNSLWLFPRRNSVSAERPRKDAITWHLKLIVRKKFERDMPWQPAPLITSIQDAAGLTVFRAQLWVEE